VLRASLLGLFNNGLSEDSSSVRDFALHQSDIKLPCVDGFPDWLACVERDSLLERPTR